MKLANIMITETEAKDIRTLFDVILNNGMVNESGRDEVLKLRNKFADLKYEAELI